MLIPLIWLKDYIKTNKSAKELAESFTALGLMLERPIETIGSTEVMDLEHRMDRADWLSILGCARDVAALEKAEFVKPEFNDGTYEKAKDIVDIQVKGEGFVNRFNTRIFKNLKNGPSPSWMVERLESYGIPTRGLIVDITNYVMVELGQPMHAHDMDKMETLDITFRKAKEGEKITTLLGEEIQLDHETWITTNNDMPTGIGGIVGGRRIAIDEHTKNIVLDSGSYDQATIRKTSRRLKIYNETVARYDKFLHPKANELAMKRATKLILDLCGPDVEVYENEDYYPTEWETKNISVRMSRVEKISGLKYELSEARTILEALEYKILEQNDSEGILELEIPYFRTDVEVEDDIVSDILRISNYKNIPLSPISTSPPKEITPRIYNFEELLRNLLVSQGLHEHITDPLLEKDNNESRVILENALSSDKSALRISIYETLNQVLQTYGKHRFDEVGVFEIGIGYTKNDSKGEFESYKETRLLQVLYERFDDRSDDSSLKLKNVKQILFTLFRDLGLNDLFLKADGNSADIYYGEILLGKLNVSGFEINTNELMNVYAEMQNSSVGVLTRAISEIPNLVSEDITVISESSAELGEIALFVKNFDESIYNVEVSDPYLSDEIGEGKKSVTLKLSIDNTADVSELRNKLFSELRSKFNLTIRE